ncbi:SURF1 family protein [Corynebacterium mayonis]|uniref:SURF1 family cytochrome oxidase biogenesis protein n=1 Tax=Corynebacterium mayonis TaxID=3062461 RepID=UPI003140B64B
MPAKNQEKPWWKTFLSPGWIIAAIAIAAFSYFAFTFLAPWQLGKNDALVQRNENIERAFENDPLPFQDILGPNASLDPADEWARVTLTGHYLPDNEVVLRLRPVEKTPAFQALTPFETTDGTVVLVNRGWAAARDGGTQLPELPPAPTQHTTITGFLRFSEAAAPQQPMYDQGRHMVYSINTGQISDLTGTDLTAFYLQLAQDEPGEIQAIPLPQLETGNHLSYGLQWIAFGLLAPTGLIYFVWAETRERRRFREEQEAMDASTALAAAAGGAGDGDKAGEAAKRPRTRYGNSRRNAWAASYEKEQER